MYVRVQKQIEQQQLLLPGETIVIGVSGGVDSIGLLHILTRLNEQYHYDWKLHVVHLNHGFRGKEADEDAAYVQEMCHTLGVICHSYYRDMPTLMKESGLGAQVASREVRYQLFIDTALEVGASKVAVAHHADDQVETVLFRMMRGTSLQGFSGMPVRRWLVPDMIELVRPLLSITREELEKYCEIHQLSPRHDSSNDSRKYKRNLIRQDIIPVLSQVNARAKEHILQLAELANSDDTYLQSLSEEALNRIIVRKENNEIILKKKCFETLDLALQRRMIPLLLSYLSTETEWSLQHVEAVLRMISQPNPSASLDLPDGIRVERMYEQICFYKGTEVSSNNKSFFSYKLNVPGTTWIPEAELYIHIRSISFKEDLPESYTRTPTLAIFDANALLGELMVRSRLPGDRISFSTNTGIHTKKVKDILIDHKVPKNKRDRIPLLFSGDQLLWIPGVKRSAHAWINDKSNRYYLIQVDFANELQEVTDE